jgi:hypothetical protein
LSSAAALHAQTVDDGVMMPRETLCTGFVYSHDKWDEYWEGTRKRSNGNIGSVTTQSVAWMGSYGVTDRVNLIAMLPYVSTKASQGTLSGQNGLQDVTLALKYNVFGRGLTRHGRVRAFLVGSAGAPASDYTPDMLPLSIGSASPRFSGRGTVDFLANRGWFVKGSAAYTWRGNVELDRPSYFTNGELFHSDETALPNVFDYSVTAGYMKKGLHAPITFSQQYTRGGGDIRRQDMPFVSNRMNVTKVDGFVMYALPIGKRNLAARVGATYTLRGRNVGQATTLSGGLLYTLHF